MPFSPGMQKVPGSGRKPGVKNKRTKAIDQFMNRIMASIEKHVDDNPNVLVDELHFKEMMDFYKAFISYYKPRLTQLKVDETSQMTVNINIKNSGA